MTTTNTWSIVQMETTLEIDVVHNVHWELTATDGEHTGRVYGSQTIDTTEGEGFTPFADLTEAQVIGWVKAALGEEQVASLEANVAAQIEAQINPPVKTPELPW